MIKEDIEHVSENKKNHSNWRTNVSHINFYVSLLRVCIFNLFFAMNPTCFYLSNEYHLSSKK